MKTTLIRIAKNGGLVALGLFIFGMMFAQIAEVWLMSNTSPRNGPVMEASVTQKVENSPGLASGLRWKLPLAMAGWGFVIMAGFETLAGLWRANHLAVEPMTKETNLVAEADAEAAIQKLLKDMETSSPDLSKTPAPVGQLNVDATTPSGR
ncbi:MAG: hypothetical protein U0798_19065 [Gemmataceae bacterium]